MAFITLILFPQIPYLLILSHDEIGLPKPHWHQMHWMIQDFLSNPFNRLESLAQMIDLNSKRLLQISPFLMLLFHRFLFKKEKNPEAPEGWINLFFIAISPFFMVLASNEGLYFLNLALLLLLAKSHDLLWPENLTFKKSLFFFYCFILISPISLKLLALLSLLLFSGVSLFWLKSYQIPFKSLSFLRSYLKNSFFRLIALTSAFTLFFFYCFALISPVSLKLLALLTLLFFLGVSLFFLDKIILAFYKFYQLSFQLFSLLAHKASKSLNKSFLENIKKAFYILLSLKAIFALFLIYHLYSLSNHQFEGGSAQLKKLMSVVYQETGWSHKSALYRIFTVGFNRRDKSLAFPYLLAEEENKKRRAQSLGGRAQDSKLRAQKLAQDLNKGYKLSRQDKLKKTKSTELKNKTGYFIINKEDGSFKKDEQARELLLETILPEELKEEMKDNKLQLKKSPYPETKKYMLVPYLITKESQFLSGFHNVSTADHSYKSKWFEENCALSILYEREGFFYLCYLIGGYFEFIGIKFHFLKEKNQNFLVAEINSPPLSIITSNRVIPHSFLEELTIHLSCKKEEALPIVNQIGLNSIYSYFNKSFFAPLSIKKQTSCALRDLKKISVSFSHQRRYMPPQDQFFDFEL